MSLNSLRDNPLFIDAVLEANRIALRTSQQEKLQALRNAVLNSALGVEPDETFHQILLNLLETLTPTHIDFLLTFDRGELFTASPDGFAWQFAALDDQPLLYKTIWKDLIDRGLLEGDLPLPNEQQNVISCRPTDLGKRFLDFIRNPVDG